MLYKVFYGLPPQLLMLVIKEDGIFNAVCKFDDEGSAEIITTNKGEIIIAFMKSRGVVQDKPHNP